MAYTLGGTTIPTPKAGNFKINIVETAGVITTLNGTMKKDIINRKYQYVIRYEKLTQTEVATLVDLWDDETTKDFAVSETNLTISATSCHVDIADRAYNTGGSSYREDLTLILTEVV